MSRHVQQITQRLINHLPEDSKYYRLDELQTKGFPSFIVQRMRLEVARNLAESMIPPKTDWANIQSDAVQNSWQQFVNAIRAEAHLPASFTKAVVETAVSEVLEVLVQPCKSIPEVIFGADDELNYEEVCKRVKAIVVYRHFGKLVPGYMRKKSLDKLSKERCAVIIENADQKLTQQYSPLNWAQMLEPLFKLLNDKIDTDLLRLFFEDKKRPHIAHRFDTMNDSLNRVQLIEVLSSPDLLNFEGYEEDQSILFEKLPHMKNVQKFEGKQVISKDEPSAEGKHENEEESTPENEPLENKAKNDLNTGFEEPASDEVEEEQTLNSVFALDNSDVGEDKPDRKVFYSEPETQDSEGKNGNSKPLNGDSESEGKESEGLNEEIPMWRRFFNDEDADSSNQLVKDEAIEKSFSWDQGKSEEDGFIDEPVIDLTNQSQPYKQEQKELLKLLSDEQNLFVEKIFGGSERAFDEAIEEIISYDNWRSASTYIEKNIFKRNLVNIYSEPAVNFTDRLQSYFLEKQNRN